MSLAEDPQAGGVLAGIEQRFARADEARMRELDAAIAAGGREVERKLCACGCLAPLGECHANRPRPPPPPPRLKTFTPTTPAPTPAEPTETTMPCGNCGSKDHNRRTCAKPGSPPKPPPAPAKVAAPARRPRIVAPARDADELLERREELLAELADVEQRLADQLAAEEDRLDRMRKAVAGIARQAKAAAG